MAFPSSPDLLVAQCALDHYSKSNSEIKYPGYDRKFSLCKRRFPLFDGKLGSDESSLRERQTYLVAFEKKSNPGNYLDRTIVVHTANTDNFDETQRFDAEVRTVNYLKGLQCDLPLPAYAAVGQTYYFPANGGQVKFVYCIFGLDLNLKNCHQLSAMQGRDIVINALRNFAQIMLAVYTRVRFRVLDRTPFWEHTEQGTIDATDFSVDLHAVKPEDILVDGCGNFLGILRWHAVKLKPETLCVRYPVWLPSVADALNVQTDEVRLTFREAIGWYVGPNKADSNVIVPRALHGDRQDQSQTTAEASDSDDIKIEEKLNAMKKRFLEKLEDTNVVAIFPDTQLLLLDRLESSVEYDKGGIPVIR